MRKTAAAILAVLAALSLAACVGGKSSEEKSSAVQESSAPETSSAEEEIELDTWAPLATTRERNIVSDDELFDYEILDGGAIITKYKGSDTEVVIPDKIGGAPVTQIGFYAFEAKDELLTVAVPATVEKICECAFCGCASLYSINLPDKLKEIERGAFVDCVSLTTITLPESVEKVGEEAFTGCEGLTELNILNPDLIYEYWGLEELDVTINAPEGSVAALWAANLQKEG